jgi:hypothetical protein
VTFCIVEFCSIKVLIHPKKKKNLALRLGVEWDFGLLESLTN